jgi:hypothetical protein
MKSISIVTRYGILPESLRPRVERAEEEETTETEMMEQISM